MNSNSVFFIFINIGLILCSTDSDTSSKLNELSHKLQEIPGIENLPQLNQSQIPTADDAKNLLRKKCEKNGGLEAFAKVENSTDDIKNCFTNMINTTVLQGEIEDAKLTGDLDRVFAKYCKKVPEVKQCVTNYTSNLNPCLEEKEKDSMKILLNVTESLTNFACYKDGDRIAMFIAEGGPECIQSKQEEIQMCANKTLSKNIPSETPTIDNLPLFILQEDQCEDIKKLQKCIVKELEKCKDPTPANIVESLFKFILKVTPCKQYVTDVKASSVTIIPSIFLPLATIGIISITVL